MGVTVSSKLSLSGHSSIVLAFVGPDFFWILERMMPIKCYIQGMLGYNGGTEIDGTIINNTRKEWGFTPAEFQEIMKHIQVLGPAIQKVLFIFYRFEF